MVAQSHRKSGIARDPENESPNGFNPTSREAIVSLLVRERFPSYVVEEPACGDGAISKVMQEFGYKTLNHDLYDHGYGIYGIDFLKRHARVYDCMVTNPPFKLWDKFLAKAIALGYRKFALFGRVGVLAGQRRGVLYRERPPARVYIFSRRLNERRPGYTGEDKPVQDYAWYIWDDTHRGHPEVHWIDWQENPVAV